MEDGMTRCAVCLGTVPGGQYVPISLDDPGCHIDDPACFRCLEEMFRAAVENEARYPVRYGIKTLDISAFKGIISEETRRKFLEKEKEYETPPHYRLYCRDRRSGTGCGKFLGSKRTVRQYNATRSRIARCDDCAATYCSICGDSASVANLSDHECTNESPERQLYSAFDGLIRGKDYQICPSSSCRRRVTLTRGCNHMTCMCGQEFCYVCGQVADDDRHWAISRAEGGCPVNGFPGDRDAAWTLPDRLRTPAIETTCAVDNQPEQSRVSGQRERRNAVVAANMPGFL